jgi:two-component system, OmpR family, phosphate regulon sensor histidine kinase PhoR
VTFRTRLFATSLAATALTLIVSTTLVSWSVRQSMDGLIQGSLVNQARMAAETLSHRRAATREDLDAEADALGHQIGARVTFVAPDGEVVGDSELNAEELRALENHSGRPEIQQSRSEGLGIARRYSATLTTEMLYVAVPVVNPDAPLLAEVRLALPLTTVSNQLAAVRRIALVAFGAGLLAALALAWGTSVLLSRRVSTIAGVADRYAAGDLSPPIRDYGNDEIGAVARVLDDSIREIGKRAADLESDRARMEAILGGMIEGVLVVSEQGRVQLVNTAARRMLRLQGEVEGRHYLEIVRQPDIAERLGATLRGDATEGLELALPRESDRSIIARSAPILAQPGGFAPPDPAAPSLAGAQSHRSAPAFAEAPAGHRSSSGGWPAGRAASHPTRGAVLVLHDITELRKADRVRRDFVANVSHELRTPLTAVRGYVEALLDGGTDTPDARRFLEIIGRHTLRMERLVRDLLRLARLDAGQEPLEHVRCSVESLFTGVETELTDALEGREQIVEHRIAADATTVTGDPAKLHDALRNLLENASNYSPASGRIVMSASRQDNRFLLCVSDQGPGVPESDLPRIFERFYRADKARSRGERDPGGTGLGLAIVKHLIELHGGTVSAANQKGGGAVFTIALPG